MFFKKILSIIWEKVLILCGVLGVLLPTSPINLPLTYRDSGVFLYIGWRILYGELPYRDIWDHKPPVVYYIDALGLWLSNNSRWGVWAIEFFMLVFAAITGFYLYKIAFGNIPASISSIYWLLSLVFIIEGGNLTEEYVLPLQFLALWLAYDIDKPNISPWRYFLIGLIGAMAFFTKQTTIGIWMAIICYITFRRFASRQIKRWIHDLLYLSIGSLVMTCFVVIFFYINGALSQFWSAVFNFNYFYLSAITGIAARLKPIAFAPEPFKYTGLFQIGMLGYIFSVIYVFSKRGEIGRQLPLVVIGLVDLPIELIFISASGKTLLHYYITLLPVLSLFAGIALWIFYSKISDLENPIKYVITIGIIGILIWVSFYGYYKKVSSFRQVSDRTVIDYIKASTTQDEYVLLWGAESATNYFTQRKSPTRFVYQYPLYAQRYVNEQMVGEFLNDIIQNRPQLIIDTKNLRTPFFDFPIHTTTIEASITDIKSHYRAIGDIGLWTIYKLVDNP